MREQIIHIHPDAPAKPPFGMPCNGCGVCCMSEPCPLGALFSRSRHGKCKVLLFDSTLGLYRCGALKEPARALRQRFPVLGRRLASWLAPPLAQLARRWIAAGIGCDSSLQVQSSPTMQEACTQEQPTPSP